MVVLGWAITIVQFAVQYYHGRGWGEYRRGTIALQRLKKFSSPLALVVVVVYAKIQIYRVIEYVGVEVFCATSI